jgi:hypothetical protein
MLADQAWFWALVAALTVALAAGEPRWRRAASAMRAGAVRRRLVREAAGQTVETGPKGRWSEPWLPGLLVGVWVCASPWIWGYEDTEGAVTADLVTGSAIALLSLAGIVFPALLALNLLAGLWLTIAPWLIGYGNDGGAVGLSDTLAGVVTCGLALRGMSVATRRLRAGPPGPVGRMPRRRAP